jgi:Raf kinase inhibitor-like YbhB/YbcL family protein
MPFILKSTSFINMDKIPTLYTCEGQDISPDLRWKGAPKGTKSFCLVMEDPDASQGISDQWILFNIPSDISILEEASPFCSEKIRRAKNSYGGLDYRGPCPPFGKHRYFFTLYALKTVLNLKEGISKTQVMDAMKGHILDLSVLIGTYERQILKEAI